MANKADNLNPEENDKQTGIEREKGIIESIIHSLIIKYFAIVEYFDIFDFLTDLFIKLLQNHIFYNGNKRTSIISLSAILWEFGYYLKWSKNKSHMYIQDYEQQIASFVKQLQRTNDNINDYNYHLIIVKKQIKKWIMDRILIAFNFRNE